MVGGSMYIRLLLAMLFMATPAYAADRILGTTNGVGIPEELTPGDAAALIGTSSGLDANFNAVPEITGATSANPMKVGNGTQKLELFGDATMGGTVRPSPLGDSVWRCWTNFNCVIRDEEGATTMFTIDPDAASKNAMYQFGSSYKPIASIPVSLYQIGRAHV